MEKTIFIIATLLFISTIIHAVAFQTQSFKDYLPYRYFISFLTCTPFMLAMILHVSFNVTDKSIVYMLMCNLLSGAAVICLYNESIMIDSRNRHIKLYRIINLIPAMILPPVSLYILFKYIYSGVRLCTS